MRNSTSTIARVILARKRGDSYQVIAEREKLSIKSVYLACTGRTLLGACALHVWRDGLTPSKFEALITTEAKRRDERARETRYA